MAAPAVAVILSAVAVILSIAVNCPRGNSRRQPVGVLPTARATSLSTILAGYPVATAKAKAMAKATNPKPQAQARRMVKATDAIPHNNLHNHRQCHHQAHRRHIHHLQSLRSTPQYRIHAAQHQRKIHHAQRVLHRQLQQRVARRAAARAKKTQRRFFDVMRGLKKTSTRTTKQK